MSDNDKPPLDLTVKQPDGPLVWRHVILNLRHTWLPGDPRGFRNRGHRTHSSGWL